MAHGPDPAAPLALVKSPPPRVVVSGVGDGFVLRAHHAPFAVSELGQERPVTTQSSPGQKHLSRLKNIGSVLDLTSLGILLILSGFVVVALAMLLSAQKGTREVKGAGVVLIGPIPIVFGSDAKWASVAITLAIVLVVVVLLFYGV